MGRLVRRPALRRWTPRFQVTCAPPSVSVTASCWQTKVRPRARRRWRGAGVAHSRSTSSTSTIATTARPAHGQVARDHAQERLPLAPAADRLRQADGRDDQVEASAEVELGRITRHGRDRQPPRFGTADQLFEQVMVEVVRPEIRQPGQLERDPAGARSQLEGRAGPPGQLAVVREVLGAATLLEIVEDDALGPSRRGVPGHCQTLVSCGACRSHPIEVMRAERRRETIAGWLGH